MYTVVSCRNYENRNAALIEKRDSLEEILELLKTDNYYHSMTTEDITKDYMLFFDLDGNDDHKIDVNAFISKMCSYINKIYYFNLKITNFCYTQNDKFEYKFHITVPSIYASIDKQKKLCIDFIGKYPEYKKLYDSTVYCKNRLFRLPNQSKGFINPKDYGIHIIKKGKMSDFILENTSEYMNYIPDSDEAVQAAAEDEVDDNDVVEVDAANDDEIDVLLESFPYEKYYTGRRSWIYFLALIKSMGLPWETACKYSKRMPDHEPCTCKKVFDSIKKLYDNPIQKIKNITVKYNNDHYVRKGFFDFRVKYDIFDFKEEFNNTKYETVKEINVELTEKLMSVCAYIIDLDCFIIKSNGNLKTIKRVKNCLPRILIKRVDGGYTEYNLQKSMIENILLNYNDVDYILNEHHNNRTFNIWKGYNAIEVEEPDNEVIEVVLDLLLNVFCNGDKEILRYVLTWFSNIVSTTEMNKVALVLVSDKQGTGKGTFLELMEKILGNHCFKAISGIGQVTQKHNTCLEGRRLLVMNEAASTKEEFRSNFDKLKSIITDPTIEIEPKGLASYEATNIGNYIIVSNHRDSVVIESNDRRYQVLECSDIYANNTDYFARVRKVLQLGDKDKMHAANSFYTYLMNYTDKVNLFKIIDTPLRQEMKERSLPNTVKFIKEYQDKIDNFETESIVKQMCCVRAMELYGQYKEWATNNGEKTATNTKFGMDIRSYTRKIYKNDGTYYIFNKTEKQCLQ